MANMNNKPFVYVDVQEAWTLDKGQWFYWMGSIYKVTLECDPFEKVQVKNMQTGTASTFQGGADVLPIPPIKFLE